MRVISTNRSFEVECSIPLVNLYPGKRANGETVVDDYYDIDAGAVYTQQTPNHGTFDRVNLVEMLMLSMNRALELIHLGCVCWVMNNGRLTIAVGRAPAPAGHGLQNDLQFEDF